MKYFICIRDDVNSHLIADRLHSAFQENNFICDEENPELVISLGGDGTFLRSVHKYIDKLNQVSFVGIHTGKLGFFCDFTRNEIDEFIHDILYEKPKIYSHPLLKITHHDKEYYGLNEVRLENPFNTMICNVYINDALLENFRGNGLNFSTSTGASAYNRSLGGPLIDPRLNSIVLGEIASINHNAYRSLDSFLVLHESSKICIRGNFKRCLIGYDHLFESIKETELEDEIYVSLSSKVVKVLHYKDVDYIYRLRKAFVAD